MEFKIEDVLAANSVTFVDDKGRLVPVSLAGLDKSSRETLKSLLEFFDTHHKNGILEIYEQIEAYKILGPYIVDGVLTSDEVTAAITDALAGHPNDFIRAGIANLLGMRHLDSENVINALMNAVIESEEKIERVRIYALWALGEIGHAVAKHGALAHIKQALANDSSWEVRTQAAMALGNMGHAAEDSLIDLEKAAIRDVNDFVKHAAEEAIKKVKTHLA